jgi:two-component system OmpR family sensor kinase/two-component system sensor histidine kinase BaeS
VKDREFWKTMHKHPHPHPMEKWEHRKEFRGRMHGSRRRRNQLFLRFASVFSLIAILALGGVAAGVYLLSQYFEGAGEIAAMVWLGVCALALALPLLAGFIAVRGFRGIATPLADVMAAADRVADGDLSVRVVEPERAPGDFRRLARSFNRMAGELERADQQRRNLTADVAHELRTPLHILQGNLEGIQDGVYEPTPEHIENMLNETHLLTHLVEDLQTLSLAESGQLALNLEPVDVLEILADVRTSFGAQAKAAGILLEIEKVQDDPLVIMADARRLDQVLSNLVVNALRHTPTGGKICLRVDAFKEGIRIQVQDTGEGIPAEQLPYVFDRFWVADRSRSRVSGSGSGLGLAIARQLVQAHGGEISVQSRLGQGTTFAIQLPIE